MRKRPELAYLIVKSSADKVNLQKSINTLDTIGNSAIKEPLSINLSRIIESLSSKELKIF